MIIEKIWGVKFLRLYSLKWSVINSIVGGIIGKSIFVISLSVPLGHLVDLGVKFQLFPFSLTGAIIISMCFILNKVACPTEIKEHENIRSYCNELLKRHKKNTLIYTDEFSILNFFEHGSPVEIKDCIESIKDYLPIRSDVNVSDMSQTIYKIGSVKYHIINNSICIVRFGMTIFLLLGFSLMYSPAIKSILNILS